MGDESKELDESNQGFCWLQYEYTDQSVTARNGLSGQSTV